MELWKGAVVIMFDDVDSPWELEDDDIRIESSRVRLTVSPENCPVTL